MLDAIEPAVAESTKIRRTVEVFRLSSGFMFWWNVLLFALFLPINLLLVFPVIIWSRLVAPFLRGVVGGILFIFAIFSFAYDGFYGFVFGLSFVFLISLMLYPVWVYLKWLEQRFDFTDTHGELPSLHYHVDWIKNNWLSTSLIVGFARIVLIPALFALSAISGFARASFLSHDIYRIEFLETPAGNDVIVSPIYLYSSGGLYVFIEDKLSYLPMSGIRSVISNPALSD
ncbi:hypothetical protein [Ruegeria sp. HKCCA0370]|uniref:hypothetical protein n=1 Tax=Ruegeria sp. HKCCA0370 TaxID=2682995 RepID=UPI001C2C4D70|nr:hypothetical protein [Ruegeria sp. HKCCA0370]